MAAEMRAREKTKEQEQSDSCPMETDSPTTDHIDVEALGIREKHEYRQHVDSPRRSEKNTGSGSDEERHKRKRAQEGSPAPSEYMRSGKRPSLTSLPPMSSLPPPGMMNPDDVTDQNLSQLVIFKGDKAMMLTVRTALFLSAWYHIWQYLMNVPTSFLRTVRVSRAMRT